MKTRALTLICAVAIVLAGATASGAEKKPSLVVKVADAVFVRPLSLGSAAVGSAVFVLGLPITAIRKEVKPAGNALVVRPINNTFHRPLGDMDAMAD
jgi:hypothetical protein